MMMRHTQRHLLFALILIGLPFLTQCNCGAPPPAAPSVEDSGSSPQADGGTDAGSDPDGGELTDVQSLEISPASPTLAQMTTRQLTATAIATDGTIRDATAEVTWSSSDAQVATVSNDSNSMGLLTAVAPGTATITATVGQISATTVVTVTSAQLVSLEITPSAASIAVGTSMAFTATGIFSDQTSQDVTQQASWSSKTPTVAAVSNDAGTRGTVSGVAEGSTDITAELFGQSGNATIAVTSATLTMLELTPTNPAVAAGLQIDFTATGTFSDGTTQDLTAQVTWSSSDGAIATVSSAAGSEGQATAVSAGTTTISATQGTVSVSTTLTVTPATVQSIAVTPPMPTLPIGATQPFVATATLSDGSTQDVTTQAIWSSSETNVASVSNAPGTQGVATAHAAGIARVTATFSGSAGSADLTVTAATLESIAVTPANPTIAKGSSQQFAATASYSDGTSHDVTGAVTWASSNTAVATISNAAGSKGLAQAVAVGQSVIAATLASVTGSTTLTVSPATVTGLVLTPANASIATGTTVEYTATAMLSDGTTQDVTAFTTFSSSNTAVATISNNFASKGVATGVSAGTTTISGTWNNVTGSTSLTVVNATLTSITVTPANAKLPRNYSLQFTATGTYSNGSTQDLTNQVTWASSNTTVASISNAAGSRGEALGKIAGTTNITATFDGISGMTALEVTNATLVSISVTPSPLTMSVQQVEQLTATGTFSDGTKLDVTAQAFWSSSKPNVASVSNLNGSEGTVFGLSVGTATITAAIAAISGTGQVTVQ